MVCYYLAVAIVLVIKLCFWGGLLILVTWLLWETLKFAVNYL